MKEKPSLGARGAEAERRRNERLAAALRENLKKRKAQARGRAEREKEPEPGAA
ncbi:MAG: hypothetical protein IRZ04_02400 [Rhodospirillales bacterium]|nr:hypothetical protein [Rhodospirillales bacterium]